MEGIGESLRIARIAAGLSQRELSRRVPTSQSIIHDLEHGKRTPTFGMLGRIAPVLGLSVLDIISGPKLFEIAFDMRAEGPTPWLERRVLSLVPARARGSVSVWPVASGVVRLRARSGAVVDVMSMVGHSIRGVCEALPAPVVSPVASSRALDVLVRAESRDSARAKIMAKVSQFGVNPRITASRQSELWRVRTDGLSARVSVGLQGLALTSPVGLFIPA